MRYINEYDLLVYYLRFESNIFFEMILEKVTEV